jgi:hypothetical protein
MYLAAAAPTIVPRGIAVPQNANAHARSLPAFTGDKPVARYLAANNEDRDSESADVENFGEDSSVEYNISGGGRGGYNINDDGRGGYNIYEDGRGGYNIDD